MLSSSVYTFCHTAFTKSCKIHWCLPEDKHHAWFSSPHIFCCLPAEETSNCYTQGFLHKGTRLSSPRSLQHHVLQQQPEQPCSPVPCHNIPWSGITITTLLVRVLGRFPTITQINSFLPSLQILQWTDTKHIHVHMDGYTQNLFPPHPHNM